MPMSRGYLTGVFLRASAALRDSMRSAGLGSSPVEDQTPLRAELFSVEQMERHGKSLAATHVLSTSRPRTRLLERLDENERLLIETFDTLTAAVRSRLRIAPSGEWLLDNFYLIEEQIRTARQHLPKEYSRGLPHLAQGPSRGLPRVYDIALEAISHGDGRVDARTLARFVAAYQTVTPLTLGELWAIPIMLRLALIENLRRVSARIMTARIARERSAALGGPDDGNRRERSEESDFGDRRHGALEPADGRARSSRNSCAGSRTMVSRSRCRSPG